MIDDGHIFVCDPPPGGKYVLTVPYRLSKEQIERLRANWEEAMKNPKNQLIVLEEGMKLTWIPACPTWPDAEYCGA